MTTTARPHLRSVALFVLPWLALAAPARAAGAASTPSPSAPTPAAASPAASPAAAPPAALPAAPDASTATAPAATASATSAASTEASDLPETQIIVPPPLPIGILLAWKPTLLSVRIDNGSGQKFGSDKIQPLRGLARYTFLLDNEIPFVGRIELEGGQFKSDTENTYVGSTGTDLTGRAMIGVSTRLSTGITVFSSVGMITRYQYGRASGGAPDIGVFGALSNMEIEFRLFPNITLSLFGEIALAPFPYASQTNLGVLSDASEFRGRIQFSVDLWRDVAADIGYDFTRWHSTFSGSSILSDPQDPALIIEDREHAMTLGIRWKL